MVEWLQTYGSLIVVTVLIAGAVWFVRSRRRAFENLELLEGAEEMAAAILTDLRTSSPGPDEPVAVTPDFWQLTKWPADRLLKLLEHMMRRGWIKFPDYDWRMQAIFHSLPTSVALTRSSYDAHTPARPAQPPLVVYGNAHLGIGDQIINGNVEHNWSLIEPRLIDLVRDVHMEAAQQAPDMAAQLERIAETLNIAITQRDAKTPGVRSALRWLAGFASNASANAAGTGIAAAASAILGMILS